MIKQFANLDGFRCYKVKNRGDSYGDRLYIAPVYIIGLPGDVEMLNKEMDTVIRLPSPDFSKGVKLPQEDMNRREAEKRLKGECLDEAIYDKERQLKGNEV